MSLTCDRKLISLVISNLCLLVLFPDVRCDAKAGFLDNLPYRLETDDVVDYEDYPIHDSDTNIPGRHISKRPYLNPIQEDGEVGLEPSPIYVASKDYGDIGDIPQGDGLKPPVGPHFDRNQTRNIIVQAGKTATLSCRVQEISKKSVSWIRLRDLHILSVDKYKYSTDQRVSVEYNESRSEWLLRIVSAKHSDAGMYECQVSTKPVLSFIVNLDVVVPEAYIVNSPDIHVHLGSLINLTCVVNHGKNIPMYIYWYHLNKIVDIDDGRKNVNMTTPSKGQTISQLLVKRARLLDSGKYSCKPSNGEEAHVTLHVLKGELQAAMQTNSGSKSSSYWIAMIVLVAMTSSRPSSVDTSL